MRRTTDGVQIGTVLGIRVLAANSFVLAVALAGFWMLRARSTPELAARLALSLSMVGSILCHELAHAKCASALGLPVRHVVLTWFGGFAELWVQPRVGWREAAVAAAGPAANIVIAALCLVALAQIESPLSAQLRVIGFSPGITDPKSVPTVLQGVLWLNIGLALFNLLPGLPLDGGYILRSALSTRMSVGRAGWIAAWSGIAVGVGCAVLGIVIQNGSLVLAGIFAGTLAWNELRAMRYD